MTTVASVRSELRDLYVRESAAIEQEFSLTGEGRLALARRTALVDSIVQRLWNEIFVASYPALSNANSHLTEQDGPNFALVATGGFGRGWLFPHSDIDLLFLHANADSEIEFKDSIRNFSQELWDLRLKLSPATRNLSECERLDPGNVEFAISLLDCRYLAGDRELFSKLSEKVVPRLVGRECQNLIQNLGEITRARHHKFANTVFHLEPNVKESPGGLRDYQATIWLRQIVDEKKGIRSITTAEEELSASAVDFLSAIRCFLHYSNGRNDNTLTYELQAAAAEHALGVGDGVARTPAEWMRQYFRHARTLNRQLLRYLEQKAAAPLTLRQRLFNAARAAKTEQGDGKVFTVRDGLLEVIDQPVLSDRAVTYSLFAEAARTGTPLSREAERSIGYILTHPELPPKNTEISWDTLREILGSDYPGVALRSMQRLALLTEVLPEFGLIDSLVVRDFYHRYTVDEHSLRTIEHLQELAEPPDERGAHFAPLWKTAERRDLLILTLLLHDIGKGMPVENHITGSLAALDSAAKRLQLSPEEKEEVHFLIEHHLDMSATVQRRDIFDPATVSAFAQSVTTLERLQRLCLLTYADIHSVNPEALTPWKAEMLWQLFVATSNHFSRTLDRDRLHAPDEGSLLERVKAQTGDATSEEIERFLEGFPRRYLAVHSAAEIAAHFALYRKLGADPVQTELLATRHGFSLTLLTADRPALFATISGVLAGWGMNINKADAFANAAGVVLDTFHFADLHRTLELNPSEGQRFRKSLEDVVNGKAPLEPLLKGRESASRARAPKVTVETRINFDDSSSAHSTLLEIVTQDHPGLLYEIGSALARLGCNIEVALIDTEGHKAIDVFYLTAQGKKLTTQKQELLREVLQGTLV